MGSNYPKGFCKVLGMVIVEVVGWWWGGGTGVKAFVGQRLLYSGIAKEMAVLSYKVGYSFQFHFQFHIPLFIRKDDK